MRVSALLLSLALLLAPLGAEAAIGLSSIRNGLIEFALEQISSPGSFEVTAEEIEDLDDGATSLVGVKVSDGTGVWLTLERLNFSWSSSALLSGELSITRLELIGLDVARAPSEEAEAPELKEVESDRGIFDWPRSPIALSIEGVKLERVTIAEGVLPQAIRFDAEGRAFDKGDLQELVFALRRTDDVAGDIAIEMKRDFAANTIRLDITANEAAGGMVAAAAGLPDDAPARLKLAADGPPEDWVLDFDAGVERVFDANGRATLQYADRLALNLDFDVVPGPELPQEVQTVLGERASLNARVIEQENGMIEIAEGLLSSPALELSATGALATGPGSSDLEVSLTALAPLADLAEGVAFDQFTFDGTVKGPQGALVAEGAIGLTGLLTAAADVGRLVLDGRVAQTADGAIFDLAGEGSGLRIDKLDQDVIGVAQLAVEGALAGDLLTLARLEVNSAALTAAASGVYNIAASFGDVSASVSAPEIAPVAAAYGVAAEGTVAATVAVVVEGEAIDADIDAALTRFTMDRVAAEEMRIGGAVGLDGGAVAFDLAGSGRALALDQIPPDLTAELALTARGGFADDVLTLEKLEVETPLVTAGAAGRFEVADAVVGIAYTLQTAELSRVAGAYGVDASGALTAQGDAEGPLTALRLAGDLSLASGTFDGRKLGDLTLSHDVAVGEAPEGEIALVSAGSEYGDAEIATKFRLDGQLLTLEAMRAVALGASVAGDAVVDLDRTLVDGAIDVETSDLAPIGDLAGVPLAGGVKGRIVLATEAGAQNVDADVALSDFSTDGAAARSADLKLIVADALGALRLDARVKAAGVDAGGVTFTSVEATATGPREAIDFTADVRGRLGDLPLSASAKGQANAASEIAEVTLASARVGLGEDSVRLRKPLALRIGGGTVDAAGLDLALPEGATLTGDATLTPEGIAGALDLRRLQLSMLQRWAEIPITKGELNAKAEFDTRPGNPNAKATAAVRGLEFEETEAQFGGLDADVTAGWNGAALDARAEIRGGFGEPVRARLIAPMPNGLGGIPTLSTGGPIDGSLVWAGDIGDLWALVPAPGHILDGRMDIDLKIGGSLAEPRPSGRIELSDGQYQNLDLGTILTQLTLRTTIAPNGAMNIALDGSDGANGTISARTALQLNGGGGFAPDTDVKINQATLIRRDDVTAQVSGDLALRGDVTNLALTGRINIDRAEVRLVNATPPSVVDLDGIRLKGAEAEDGNGGAANVLSLDLKIEANRDIFVRGRGLDSEWGMDLSVGGFATAPIVTGVIERVRGQLDLLGRPFELARGKVTFDGGREINPLIDIGLELEANGIRGGIYVEGRANAPELKFASNPSLPEDEVMPRLLFGRSKQSLSGPEAVQLAAGIATLLSGRAGPLDFAREAAGIDVLRVEGETVDDASVTVGQNVSEGVFVGARQKLSGEGSAVAVEVDVFEGVVVDTELGQEGSNVGITWRKDF